MLPRMDSKLEEEYVFHRLADADFAQALASIRLINTATPHFRCCLIRDSTTAYCRPFKNCRGRFGIYKLNEKLVPKSARGLHKRLIDLRDEVFAHTDLNARSPVLACWPNSRYPIRLKAYDYEGLLEKVGEIEALVSGVRHKASERMLKLQNELPNSGTKRL